MKYIINKWFVLFVLTSLFFSCIRKKDFELNKVKWDDITPAWGLPLVNSTLSIDNALNKNNSRLIIQRDNNGFITFIYLDTVYTPLGEAVLEAFNLTIPTFHSSYSLGTIAPLPPPNTGLTNLPSLSGSFNFELDSVETLTKVIFKSGNLKVKASSLLQHQLSFTLKIPDLKNAFGTSYSTDVKLSYDGATLPTIADIEQNMSGYSITSTSGNNSSILYYIENLKITTLGNSSGQSNPILSTDSIMVDLEFEKLKIKFIEGKFLPLTIEGIPSGVTDINAFNNALSGDISFKDPSLNFNFLNSYGLTPQIQIDSARMEYAYGSRDHFKDFTAADGNLQITGPTFINPATIPGQFSSTPFSLNRNTSNLVDVLQGAPDKFFYQISRVELSGGSNGNAFISDDSRIQINTEVKIPLYGSIRSLVISDTAKKVNMPEGKNVDYIEFRVGSENSIPASVRLQAYFADTNLWYIDSTKYKTKYFILDSLVSNPEEGLIIAPGAILDTTNTGDIIKTQINTFSTSIAVSKEKYNRISTANAIIIKGTMFSKNSSNDPSLDKSVKFFTWQTCTFHLAAFAILRINPGRPDEIINIGQ